MNKKAADRGLPHVRLTFPGRGDEKRAGKGLVFQIQLDERGKTLVLGKLGLAVQSYPQE